MPRLIHRRDVYIKTCIYTSKQARDTHKSQRKSCNLPTNEMSCPAEPLDKEPAWDTALGTSWFCLLQ